MPSGRKTGYAVLAVVILITIALIALFTQNKQDVVTITGIVVEKQDVTLPDVQVQVYCNETLAGETQTDSVGSYRLTLPHVPKYRIMMTKEGYQTLEHPDIAIARGDTFVTSDVMRRTFSLRITPKSRGLFCGETLQFQCFKMLSDSTRELVTQEAVWSLSTGQAGSVSAEGRFTASASDAGVVTVSATYLGKADSATVTISLTLGGIGFVYVKGGTFEMGDVFGEGGGDEKPVHTVTVDDFYMSKTEVTFAQYDAFCDATRREKPGDSGWGRGNRPVINVSWNDATAYCQWLTRQTGQAIRLPTEAEWEYAAREGGRRIRFGNGKDIADPSEINFDGTEQYKKSYSRSGVYRKMTLPAASFSPNALGLYDMSGNVWEWCSDWYDGDYYKNSTTQNPQGPSTGQYRVLRGGSWYLIPNCCRSANRYGLDPDVWNNYGLGFRIVRTN